jgi:hypothetical protein
MAFNLPHSFETEAGSRYIYLEDGRAERYKYTGERRPPHDVTIFIPDSETLANSFSRESLDRMGLTHKLEDYDLNLIEWVYSGEYGFFVTDQRGSTIENPEGLARSNGDLILLFQKRGIVDFHIPISRIPRIGWSVFQTTSNDEGTRNHLGHKVTKINP